MALLVGALLYGAHRSTTRENSGKDAQNAVRDGIGRRLDCQIKDVIERIDGFGKSAFTGKNLTEGALGAFVKAVEAGKVERGSYLLVEVNRPLVPSGRAENFEAILAQVEARITIVTLADERAYLEESLSNDMTDIIISIVIMSRAYEESQRKADRLSISWAQKRKLIGERALTGTCPAWLQKRDDWSGFDIVEERAVIVREIFSLCKTEWDTLVLLSG